MNASRRGFSLIELMVVIALIGILSAIVLASLSKARQNASDVAIKANLSTIQVQAEVYAYANGNNYGSAVASGRCATSGTMFIVDPTIQNALTAISKIEGCILSSTCTDDASKSMNCNIKKNVAAGEVSYSVVAKLSNGYWCIDSVGANRGIASMVGADTPACPAS